MCPRTLYPKSRNRNQTHRRLRLGVSSCLLGERVRYDGSHKRDAYVAQTLNKYFDLVPLCPEVAIGLGVPRAPIHLVGSMSHPHALRVHDPAVDVTAQLKRYGRRMARAERDLSGYIFKSRSPSCGLVRVPVRTPKGPRCGRGIYAAAVLKALPLLPAEEEGRLGDPRVRDNFIERVFAYRRWRELEVSGITAARLRAFHAAHELALLAHGPGHYRALGRIVARTQRGDIGHLSRAYGRRFMAALQSPATRERHARALTMAAKTLEPRLGGPDRAELLDAIRAYRAGKAFRAMPLTLLRRHLRRFPHPELARQTYLNPDPLELKLRAAQRR